MSKIDFEAKTDRELNILTAQAVNDINEEKLPAIYNELHDLNGTVRDHEKRIIKVETKQKMRRNNPGTPWPIEKLSAVAQGWTGAILTMAAIMGIIYGLGAMFGWWS